MEQFDTYMRIYSAALHGVSQIPGLQDPEPERLVAPVAWHASLERDASQAALEQRIRADSGLSLQFDHLSGGSPEVASGILSALYGGIEEGYPN